MHANIFTEVVAMLFSGNLAQMVQAVYILLWGGFILMGVVCLYWLVYYEIVKNPYWSNQTPEEEYILTFDY